MKRFLVVLISLIFLFVSAAFSQPSPSSSAVEPATTTKFASEKVKKGKQLKKTKKIKKTKTAKKAKKANKVKKGKRTPVKASTARR